MTASEWLELTELLVITWQMVESPPPRFQLETVPPVWSRLLPSSKVEFVQKLPGNKSARTIGAPQNRNIIPASHITPGKEANRSLKAENFSFFGDEFRD